MKYQSFVYVYPTFLKSGYDSECGSRSRCRLNANSGRIRIRNNGGPWQIRTYFHSYRWVVKFEENPCFEYYSVGIVYLNFRVVDPDCIRIQWLVWIRIRNPDRDPWAKKRKKSTFPLLFLCTCGLHTVP
jgi:hypothetical protein